MAESLLKKAMDMRGLPFNAAYKLTGLTSSVASKHYRGVREISANDALIYEKALGIPRYELRPDLWTPAMFWYVWADKEPNPGKKLPADA